MRRDHYSLYSPAIDSEGDIVAYGNYGRPLLVFPSEQGRCFDYENNGMIGSIAHLIEEGRVKVYCVDSFDAGSWVNQGLALEEKARQHERYESWIIERVVPMIFEDSGGPQEIMTTGCSFGAYHAANLCLKHADIFTLGICQSGVYDVASLGGGERGETVYFNNPMDYVANFEGEHLDWIRSRVSLVLVCGQGMWEDTTGALEGTKRFGSLLASKGIPHEVDLWGHDVPHDWPSWRNQIAHHLPRFV
ncbi:MAG: esterase family protein [Actinomycetota bacterium]